jgi:hypothetical protein
MHQFAWLELFGGNWLLLNDNSKYPARSWVDKYAALAELEEEGWTIAGPFRKRLSMTKPRHRSCGYAMMRTVH